MIKAENNINYMGSVMPVQQGEIPKPARFSITGLNFNSLFFLVFVLLVYILTET